MTKTQQLFYDWGAMDAAEYPEDHPDQLLQEAWHYFLTERAYEDISWPTLIANFPFYKKGILKTTKFYEN